MNAAKRCDGGWGWWADGIVETKVAAAGMAAMYGVKRVTVRQAGLLHVGSIESGEGDGGEYGGGLAPAQGPAPPRHDANGKVWSPESGGWGSHDHHGLGYILCSQLADYSTGPKADRNAQREATS